jgi:hypothetical protein
MSNNRSAVVPAKAGTHTAESLDDHKWHTLCRNTSAWGYGSRVALGFASLARDDIEIVFGFDC